METSKTFQFKITYFEDGAVKTEQYDKEFTPFELLGIITHIKNEIEVELLQHSNPQNQTK